MQSLNILYNRKVFNEYTSLEILNHYQLQNSLFKLGGWVVFPLSKSCFVALTRLKLLVQEGARFLVSPILLQAIEEHFLIIRTGSSHLLLIHLCSRCHLLLLLLRGRRRGIASPTKRIGHGAYGTMSNGGTSSEGHALGNG